MTDWSSNALLYVLLRLLCSESSRRQGVTSQPGVRGHARGEALLTLAPASRRSTTPKRVSSSQTFLDTAFTAGGDMTQALPVVYAPAAAPVLAVPPDSRVAMSVGLGHQAPLQLLPPGLQPPAALQTAPWQHVRMSPTGIPQLPMATATVQWQTVSPAAGACAPRNSLQAELLAVRAVVASASAQLHGCQAQLVQVTLSCSSCAAAANVE